MSSVVDSLREIMGEPMRDKAEEQLERFLLSRWAELTEDDRDLARVLYERDHRPAEIALQLVDRIEERRMRAAGYRLSVLAREILMVAYENGGEFFLLDSDPLREQKRRELVGLCDRGSEALMRRNGFRSSRANGGFFFRLTPKGVDAARVVCAS